MIKEKRVVASFLPCRVKAGEMEFYLQKREPNRRILPSVFTMFGGGIENGETAEEGCLREIKEELNYTPKNMQYFTRYEVADGVIDVFLGKVGDDFESQVNVQEGEYGKFIKRSEIRNTHEIALFTRLAAIQVALFFEQENTSI